MADYWKSNPRHFCKFCKCWIADNKPSRDFHEKGKKHQENVQRKITEVRKKSTKDAQKKEEENSYMKEMEEAAHKAFVQDLKSNPKLAEQYLEKARKAKATVEDAKPNKPKTTTAPKTCEPVIQGTWRITHTPEGYPYYWNDITAEVSWTKPEGVDLSENTGQTVDDNQSHSQQEEESNSDVMGSNLTEGYSHQQERTATEGQVSNVTEQDSESSSSEEEQAGDEGNHGDEDNHGDDGSHGDDGNHGDDISTETKKKETKQEQSLPIPFDPSDISSIPLPGDISLPAEPPPAPPSDSPPPLPPGESEPPPPPEPSEECTDNQDATTSEYEDIARETVNQKKAHDSAYGGWEQVVYEEPEQVDLQLPEVEHHVEQKVITVKEPKVKFREKKVNSLGDDFVAFKKRKMNNRNLKQRMDT